jgi:hypothetical protein
LLQEIIRLTQIGEGALDLSGRALPVQVPDPFQPPIKAGMHPRQRPSTVRMEGVNDLELTDSAQAKL